MEKTTSATRNSSVGELSKMTSTLSDHDDAHATLVADTSRVITERLRGKYAVRKATYHRSDEECDNDRQSYLSAGITDYSTRTLQKLISMRSDAKIGDHYSLLDYIIRLGIHNDESFVIDYLHLAECFSTTIRYKRVAQSVLAIEALNSYEGLAPHCLGDDYPDQRANHGVAIISVTDHLRRSIAAGDLPEETLTRKMFESENESLSDIIYDFSDAHLRIINDKKLRSLLTNPDYDPAAITKIITERNLISPDDIISVMESQRNNPSQAVSSGTL